MTTTEPVREFEAGELAANASFEPADRLVRVTLKGCADSRVVTEMGELLVAVHDAMVRTAAEEAVVDLRALEFMNSSCFKAYVTWLSRVQDLAPGSQYRVRFLSDAKKHWQRRSLGALRSFAIDLVHIEG
jgi:hypothetical protein